MQDDPVPTAFLRPVSLPISAEGTLDYLPEQLRTSIDTLLAEAKRDRRWDTPQRLKFDPSDPEFWAYAVYKTGNPTRKALPGSGLEDHFAPFAKPEFGLDTGQLEQQTSITLSAVGDLMSTAPELECAKDRLYRHVTEEVFGADISYANLESVLTGNEDSRESRVDGTPVTYATFTELESLIRHCGQTYDVLHLANNHTMDFGDESVTATLRVLDDLQIAAVGVNRSARDAMTPRITQHGEVSIGWIAHTYGLNGKPQPVEKPWRVNVTGYHASSGPDITSITAQIGACRDSGCDLVFVSVHWGPEWELYPLPEQVQWAHQYAEAGADALIGHHPHVIQPVEIYQPHAFPEKSVPIIYSLGNLTPVLQHPATVLTMAAQIEISTGLLAKERRTFVSRLRLIPMATLESCYGDAWVPEIRTLARLNQLELDYPTRCHVKAISDYADRVLGTRWRAVPQTGD